MKCWVCKRIVHTATSLPTWDKHHTDVKFRLYCDVCVKRVEFDPCHHIVGLSEVRILPKGERVKLLVAEWRRNLRRGEGYLLRLLQKYDLELKDYWSYDESSGHAPSPGGSGARDLGEVPDGLGADENKREV